MGLVDKSNMLFVFLSLFAVTSALHPYATQEGRIVNGEDVTSTSVAPWQVSLQRFGSHFLVDLSSHQPSSCQLAIAITAESPLLPELLTTVTQKSQLRELSLATQATAPATTTTTITLFLLLLHQSVKTVTSATSKSPTKNTPPEPPLKSLDGVLLTPT